jgi:hypothetical protein
LTDFKLPLEREYRNTSRRHNRNRNHKITNHKLGAPPICPKFVLARRFLPLDCVSSMNRDMRRCGTPAGAAGADAAAAADADDEAEEEEEFGSIDSRRVVEARVPAMERASTLASMSRHCAW